MLTSTVPKNWSAFLMDAKLAKEYNTVNLLTSVGDSPPPNPIVEALLPSLLYIRLGAFLDEVFEEHIAASGLVMSRQYRSDLNGKLTFLSDQGRLKNLPSLHVLRTKRNELAHEASRACTWAELENAIGVVDDELQHLGLVGPRPKYDFYAERNPRREPEPGCLLTFDYCYGLKDNGQKAIEISWTVHHHGLGDDK